jgi:hypothetical protein
MKRLRAATARRSREVVVASEQTEAVSPATKLLEKRRTMYEN